MATTPAATPPTLADFPDAEVVGGAVIVDGKNMGTLTTAGTVEVSPLGEAFLATPTPAEVPPIQSIETLPDPIPVGVLDPTKMAPVEAKAKAAVRKRKQNEAVVAALNSPTAEEETAFAAADAAEAAPPAEPPAPAPAPTPTAGI